MHRQMNHKTTIIEVIGHGCSQRDRRVYSQRESRLAAFEGKAKGIREIENTSWKVLAYGIYARVVDVSEIERVSAANE